MTLYELLQLIRRHLVVFLSIPLMFAAATFGAAQLMPERWGLSLTAYVHPTASADGIYTNADISASQMIAVDVATLLDSDIVKSDVASKVGDDFYDYGLRVTSSSTTRVITLGVTGTNRERLSVVANAVFESAAAFASQGMGVTTLVKVAETVPYQVGPSKGLLALAAGAVGVAIAVVAIILRDRTSRRNSAPAHAVAS
ncbi:MAG: hypothetical protein QM302_00795 [Acidobacteriota bacterium]|nr:hypothetical protein [Acidobacteriota bacterium]